MLKTCQLHKITYQTRLDPHCPQCTIAGITDAEQTKAVPGQHGAPAEETD